MSNPDVIVPDLSRNPSPVANLRVAYVWGIGQADGGKVLSRVDRNHASHPSRSASNWSNFLSVDGTGSASVNQEGFRLGLGEVCAANIQEPVGMVTHSRGVTGRPNPRTMLP